MIRKNADWMIILDERILESLRDNGPSSPAVLALSKGVRGHEEEICYRCDLLIEYNLIEEQDDGFLRITRKGRRYLDGEIDLGKDDSSSSLIVKGEKEIRATGIQVSKDRIGDYCTGCAHSPA